MVQNITLTAAVGARFEWILAIISDINDLIHAYQLLDLLGDLGAQARCIDLLNHTATCTRRSYL